MFMVRRSLPAYPISTTFRASTSMARLWSWLLFHRGVGGGVEDDRLHLDEQRRRLGEEGLPFRVLHELAPHGGAVVEIAVGPHVHDLVELPHLRLPEADILRVLLADRHDGLVVVEPFPRPSHR